MASYAAVKNRILVALAKQYVEGKRNQVIMFDWSKDDPDNEAEKKVLAELRSEGSIEQGLSTTARFTDAVMQNTKIRLKLRQ